MLLGEYMVKNYKHWLTEFPQAKGLESEELFLVTGTYMTRNWETTAFGKDANASIGGDWIADVIEGKIRPGLRTPGDRRYQLWTGHSHMEGSVPRHLRGLPCTACPDPPENQCIFLRGWRVKEAGFFRSLLGYSASAESTENETLLIKKRKFKFGLFGGMERGLSTFRVGLHLFLYRFCFG
jgi:hypothetical protein